MANGTQTEAARGTGRSKKPLGRQDAEHQETVIETKVVKDKINHLVKLKTTADEAVADFADAVKKVAEDSGLLAASVRKFVVARAGEGYEEAKRKCEQLSLLFEEVGE